MSNDMTTRKTQAVGTAIAFDPGKLAGMAAKAQEVARGIQKNTPDSDVNYLPLLKVNQDSGHWTFGQAQLPIEDDDVLVIDPTTMSSGIQLWEGRKPIDTRTGPIWETHPTLADAPQYVSRKADDGWSECREMLLTAEDGTIMRFSTTSLGGKRAFDAIANAVSQALVTQQPYFIPRIQLSSETYYHKGFEKDFRNPVFDIVDWQDAEGNLLSAKGDALPEMQTADEDPDDLTLDELFAED